MGKILPNRIVGPVDPFMVDLFVVERFGCEKVEKGWNHFPTPF